MERPRHDIDECTLVILDNHISIRRGNYFYASKNDLSLCVCVSTETEIGTGRMMSSHNSMRARKMILITYQHFVSTSSRKNEKKTYEVMCVCLLNGFLSKGFFFTIRPAQPAKIRFEASKANFLLLPLISLSLSLSLSLRRSMRCLSM